VLFFRLIGSPFGMDHYVVHIDREASAHDLFMEYCIHHGLKCSRGIGESQKHYCWFKESLISYECRFVLVFWYDSDCVVPPSNVDCGD
jgi:hypothetical protein